MMASKPVWMYFLPECIIIACHGISIKSFVWIFFIFALISFAITYIHVMLVLEIGQNDIGLQFGANYDYLDAPGINVGHPKNWANQNNHVKLEDDAREGRNMMSTHIIESPLTEICGWWIPNARWTAQLDCKTGLSHICRKILVGKCERDKVQAIYQFLPISPDVHLTGLQFSSISSSAGLIIDEDYDKESTLYSAIAYLKYTDRTYDYIRLDFSPGSYTEERLAEEKLLPMDKVLDSITVILACRGYQGPVNFHETVLLPIGNGVADDDINLLSCTRGDRSYITNHSSGSVIEKLIKNKPSSKGELFESTISLVTQVNMDHIELLHNMLSYWKYPISAAIFIPGERLENEGDKQNWKRLYIQKKLSRMKFPEGSSVLAVYASSLQEEYHQNFLRNLAFSFTSEEFVFLLDVGFLPSPGFRKEFRENVLYLEDQGRDISKIAFIIPVFQMVKDLSIPNSKEELKKLVTGDDPGAVSYKRLTDPDAHRPTDYRRWFRAKEPYLVDVYQEKYEPYVIVKKTAYTPRFDEHFKDKPLDRISYTMELLAAGYDLLVLPNIWAMAEASYSSSSSEIQEYGFFRNIELYISRFEFITELMRNYHLGPCEQTEETADSEQEDT